MKEIWQQKEQWGWRLEARGDVDRFEKKRGGGGRQYKGLHKIGEFGALCHLWLLKEIIC